MSLEQILEEFCQIRSRINISCENMIWRERKKEMERERKKEMERERKREYVCV
jgi:hypothetical protein